MNNAPNEERDYARKKGLSEDLVKRIQNADNNNVLGAGEKILIDYLATLDKPLQQKVVDGFLSDGRFSIDEAHQIQFLQSFPRNEQMRMINDGSFTNNNIDGDSWTNYFEKFVSKTPYDVKNDIYAIVMTMAGREYKPIKEMFEILEKANIPKEHVYELNNERNNAAEFKAAAEKIAQVADKNDTVLFVIDGEGSPGNFAFRDWTGMSSVRYTWFKELIDNIHSKNKVIIVDTCYSGSAIKYLEGANTLVLTGGTDKQKIGFEIEEKFLKAFSNPIADKDKNNYVSIGEAAEYAKIVRTSENITPQISDISNMGKTSYLIEQPVG
ncbi:MAG: C13 family peptidase [Candidatus Bathyarchaeia archaeon]